MNTSKLTLSISEEIVLKAKSYAKQRGTSISFLVENFLSQITQKENPTSLKTVNKLKGIIKLPDDYNYKDDLSNLYSK
jgi:hypothetical protein